MVANQSTSHTAAHRADRSPPPYYDPHFEASQGLCTLEIRRKSSYVPFDSYPSWQARSQ